MYKSDLESKRPALFFLGLIVASSLSLTAFTWRFPDESQSLYIPLSEEDVFIELDWNEVLIERPKAKTNQSPSKKKSTNIEASDDPPKPLKRMGEEIKPIQTIKSMSDVNRKVETMRSVATPSTVSMRELKAHEMPFFRNCGQIKDAVERFQCTQLELRRHIGREFKVPPKELVRHIPDKMNVTFVIDASGIIRDVKISEEVDEDLLDEVIRVFKNMPDIVPATAAGNRISVRFEIPMSIQRIN